MLYLFKKRKQVDKNQLPRERWLEAVLRDIPVNSRILDAGAGERQYQKYCTHLRYVSQDFAAYDGAGDGHGLQTTKWNNEGLDIVGDITHIPEPDASFDAIMCIEVLEHLPNPVSVFPEFARLLKPGGFLILTAPFNSLTHFAPYHYSTGFNTYFYRMHLQENGFEVVTLTPNGNFFSYMEQEMMRLPDVAKKFSRPLTYIERIIRYFVLKMVVNLHDSDTGSNELLCFGYHVLAKKSS